MGKPRLIFLIADRPPAEDRDLVLDGVDAVADDGEDEEEEDDDDGDDDVAFDHSFERGGGRLALGGFGRGEGEKVGKGRVGRGNF